MNKRNRTIHRGLWVVLFFGIFYWKSVTRAKDGSLRG